MPQPDRPYLHLGTYDGGTFLAIVTDEPILKDGHFHVLDYEVVESRNQATDWYLRMCRDRPWDKR